MPSPFKVGWRSGARQPYFESMPLFFALALIALPLLDIVSLIKAGALLGFWPTLGLLAAAAALGTWVIRQQRFPTAARLRRSLAAGELPLREAFDGVCLLVAGLMLMFPGFISDAVALLLLLPPLRAGLWTMLGRSLAGAGATVVWRGAGGIRGQRVVIDGEFEPVGGAAQPSPSRPPRRPPETAPPLPAPVIVDRHDP